MYAFARHDESLLVISILFESFSLSGRTILVAIIGDRLLHPVVSSSVAVLRIFFQESGEGSRRDRAEGRVLLHRHHKPSKSADHAEHKKRSDAPDGLQLQEHDETEMADVVHIAFRREPHRGVL